MLPRHDQRQNGHVTNSHGSDGNHDYVQASDVYEPAAGDPLSSSLRPRRRESKLGAWKSGRQYRKSPTLKDNQVDHDDVRSVTSYDSSTIDDDTLSWASLDATFSSALYVSNPKPATSRSTYANEWFTTSQFEPPLHATPPPLPPSYYPSKSSYRPRQPSTQPQMDLYSSQSRYRTDELHSLTLCQYFDVEFKRRRRVVCYGEDIYALGDYVKVEADRGFDVGVVVQRHGGHPLYSQDFSSASTSMKRVLRRALAAELHLLECKLVEEAAVLQVCRDKVHERRLPMHVLDAEFQFDRHKLTFFFHADRRIDFRDLVRDLFALYKTRIWMQQVCSHPNPSACA